MRIPKGLVPRIEFYKRRIGQDRDKLRVLFDDIESIADSAQRSVEDLDYAIDVFESRLSRMKRCRERIADGRDSLESIMEDLKAGSDSAKQGVSALEDAIETLSEYV